MLLMLVAGIGFAQAISSPQQVTLRWLRLGGLISVALLASAVVVILCTDAGVKRHGVKILAVFGLPVTAVVAQLIAAQLGWRQTQRFAAAVVWVLTSILIAVSLPQPLTGFQETANPWAPPRQAARVVGGGLTAFTSSALLGGTLMTMLLGHAYLTVGGDMTQAPFRRLIAALGLAMLARTVVSIGLGFWPWWQGIVAADRSFAHPQAAWDITSLVTRYLVGLVVPAVFLCMTWDCIRRRSNQSATGILYVAFMLLILGEGTALALMRSLTGHF